MARKIATKTKMTKKQTTSKQAKKQPVSKKAKATKTRTTRTAKDRKVKDQKVKGQTSRASKPKTAKSATRKPVSKRKPVAKKPVVKKTAVKKTAVKKAAAKRPVSKKQVTKKEGAKKQVAKKQTAKKQAKKQIAKKTPTKQRTIAKPNVKTKAKPKAQLQTKTSRKTTATKKPIRKSPIPKSPTSKSATKQPIAKKAKPVARNSAKGFRVNEHIVYPSHGVGQIIEIAEQEIQGQRLDLFVVNFEREKMVLRVPIAKATQTNGMRKLADKRMFDKAMKTLRGRARIKRTMWSRRAQEYEAKINSGDLIAIAEVVRDLYRNDTQPEQSYSERQLYEAALDRMAREVAAIQKIGEAETILQLEDVLYHATIKTVPKPTEKIEEKIEENAAQPKL